MVAAGGSATISGVLYQILHSLLHVTKLSVVTPAKVTANRMESVTIILEPSGGGGDLVIKGNGNVVVEQIKARGDNSAWSLKEVIEDVLPDLFMAADAGSLTNTTYRFVTEGRMGGWSKVYENFFRQLQKREYAGEPLRGLDDTTVLACGQRTGVSRPFFPNPCTERTLFLKIAKVISDRPSVQQLGLSEAELLERVRRLLAHFEFVGNQGAHEIQQMIDVLLFAIVDKQHDIPKVRDHLAIELAKLATKGGEIIEASAFLSSHGLSAIPLTQWRSHVASAKTLVQRATQRSGYNKAFDVRLASLPRVPTPGTILVVTGESGTGKSWTLSALAESYSGPHLPIFIESTGSADTSLQKCAEIFWSEIHDSDEVLALSRIAKRLQKITSRDAAGGLIVFIDRILAYEEVRLLVEKDWSQWESGLVISCRTEHADNLQQAYPNRLQIFECKDFTWEQLHDYVDRRLESGWAEIPLDVRETLRKPLLASVYCDEFGESGWDSPSEYELYQRVWDRLSAGQQSDWPLDAGYVEFLARKVRSGAPYPWSQAQLIDVGIDNDALRRLQQVGWVIADGDRYRVFHDRLLQWAVARSLCSDLRDGRIAMDAFIEFVTKQIRDECGVDQIPLGYIPMDVLWMLTQEGQVEVATLLLESLEQTHGHYSENLYEKLIPTIGSCAADAVYNRLRSLDGPPWILTRITKCLSIVGKSRIEEFARPLVESADCVQQRRGVKLVGLVACPALLDAIWTVHNASQRDPLAFGEDEDGDWLLYRETFDALKIAVRCAPDWLRSTLERADPSIALIHDLAWLAANLDDGGRAWHSLKDLLFQKTAPEHARSLIHNIAKYRDSSQEQWIEKQVDNQDDHVTSSSALMALARLNPDAAVNALPRVKPVDLCLTRHWAFAEVFARRPAQTHAKMLEWMKSTEDPWWIALAYQDRENDISTEELDVALDGFCRTLDAHLRGESDPRKGVHLELKFLSRLAAPEHLQVLRARRGTKFERLLCDYVRKSGPQAGEWSTGLEREPALTILHLIGGEGLPSIANDFLVGSDKYGTNEAIRWAAKRPNITTFERLRKIVLSDECWTEGKDNSHPVNQNDAMRVFGRHGQWENLVEGLKKWGMRTSPELKDCPKPILEPWVDQFRQSVKSSPTAGNVLALGAVGGNEDCNIIHNILDKCDAQSDLAHACVIALEDLNDSSDDGVARVAEHLCIEKHRYSATRMLTNAGSHRAWSVLFEDLKSHFDLTTALNLINLSDHATEVVEITLPHIREHRWIEGYSLHNFFITRIRCDEIRNRILQDEGVRDLFHQASAYAEGNSWCVGSKANAIKCLAEFAPESAFKAACHALSDVTSHDRELYPSILVEIDRARGIEWLINHLPLEDSRLVRIAIGRILENRIPLELVVEKMASKNQAERTAGVELCGWANLDEAADIEVDKALNDQSEDVVQTAIGAMQRRRDRRVVLDLCNLIVQETEGTTRTITIDALIGFVDPGDAHRPVSTNLRKALDTVSTFESMDALKRLKKRREQLHEELKKPKTL